ncbi:MAG: hypothetical protein IKR53_05985, partial [Clostridia bacterium]|nr:hypothetical protein [Clostridia bacterium]
VMFSIVGPSFRRRTRRSSFIFYHFAERIAIGGLRRLVKRDLSGTFFVAVFSKKSNITETANIVCSKAFVPSSPGSLHFFSFGREKLH